MPTIARFVALLCGIAAGVLVLPSTTLAHPGGAPLIHVPADHIEQGESFRLIAADLGQNAHVTLELAGSEKTAMLGTVTAGPDGHFEATLTLPESFPDGYAELTATSDDGSFASEWIRVGAGPDLGPPPSVADAPLIDPSLLLVVGGVLVLFLLWRFRGGWGRSQRG